MSLIVENDIIFYDKKWEANLVVSLLILFKSSNARDKKVHMK